MEQRLQSDIKEITELLSSEKRFTVIGSECSVQKLGFTFCLHVRDINNKESSLLVFYNNNPKCLHMAKIQSKYLKSMHHPNIAEFIDEFPLGQFYIVQIERIYISLLDWIRDSAPQNPMSEQNYVDIALSMMEMVYYLNKNKCSLSLISTLSCFSINKEMKIKLFYLDTPKVISIAMIKSILSVCKEKSELFYYRKEVLTLDDRCKISQTFLFDIWAVGICLYHLSGITTKQILCYIDGTEPFVFSESLGFQSNSIIHFILFDSDNNNSQYRYSFLHFIGSLQNQQKQLLKEGQLIRDQINKQEEIKTDFDEYLRMRNSMKANNFDRKFICNLEKLIEKYGEPELLLNFQAKLYFFNENNFDKAVSILKRMVEINPLSDLGYFCLGFMYTKRDVKQSRRYYEKALEINAITDSVYLNLGISYYDDRQLTDAIKYYFLALQSNPNHRTSLIGLGLIFKQENKKIQCRKKLLELRKEDESTFNTLAQLYYNQSLFEKAFRYWNLRTAKQDQEYIIKNIKKSI